VDADNQEEKAREAGLANIRRHRSRRDTDKLVKQIKTGNRTALSQAITLVESSKQEHQQQAQSVVERCLPHANNSIRIGITGIPGVGKSTFIESLGNHILEQEHKLAVLAVDPTSTKSRGSILGDKTRMETLANHNRAYIRPSSTGGSLGGVARKTRESIILCEAAGYDIIFIETVGVGQSEITVHSMVDFFLLLMIAGAGDELQGIKRGIVEMADAIAINKADGDNKRKAQRAAVDFQRALHLYPPAASGWQPEVKVCSALSGKGIDNIWEMINEYVSLTQKNGYFRENRKKQAVYWLHETIRDHLMNDFYQNPDINNLLPDIEDRVSKGDITSYRAARKLLKTFKEK